MSDNFWSSPYQRANLDILQQKSLTPEQKWKLVDEAVSRVKALTQKLAFSENAERSCDLSEIIIQAIAQNKKLILTYNEWDKDERKLPRQVVPLALLHATRIPGNPIFSSGKNGMPQSTLTHVNHSHFKVHVFQTEGHSKTMQRGFKDLNLSDITNLWTSPTDPDEDDIQEINEKFVLQHTTAHVEYILQLNQASLKE